MHLALDRVKLRRVLKKKIEITDKRGLHLRPRIGLSNLREHYLPKGTQFWVEINYKGRIAKLFFDAQTDGDAFEEMMCLEKGAKMTLCAKGPHAKQALEEAAKIINPPPMSKINLPPRNESDDFWLA